MKTTFPTLCAMGAVLSVVSTAAFGQADKKTTRDELIEMAAAAHEHLMRGDIGAYRQRLQVAADFTLMDPFGGTPTGAPSSDEHWERIGRLFQDGQDASFKPIAFYHSGDIAVLVAHEHAHVAVASLDAQLWSLRVTLVFRRDDGVWQLAHRHADPLAFPISVEQAALFAKGGTK